MFDLAQRHGGHARHQARYCAPHGRSGPICAEDPPSRQGSSDPTPRTPRCRDPETGSKLAQEPPRRACPHVLRRRAAAGPLTKLARVGAGRRVWEVPEGMLNSVHPRLGIRNQRFRLRVWIEKGRFGTMLEHVRGFPPHQSRGASPHDPFRNLYVLQ